MRSNRFTQFGFPKRTAVAAVLTASITLATSGAASASTAQVPPPDPAPTGPLTVDQMKTALPTDADVPGYTFDATQDTSTLTTKQDVLTTGGAACQKFVDATEGLTTTYGTLAEVDRQLHETTGGHTIDVIILSFNNPDAAHKALADAKDGISGCTNIAGTAISGAPTVGTLGAIPQLVSATDRLGYLGYLTVGGQAVLLAGETVQVGSTIVEVEMLGPQTTDNNTLTQLGTTLGTVTNIVTGKVGSLGT